jgi:hypothetical protein
MENDQKIPVDRLQIIKRTRVRLNYLKSEMETEVTRFQNQLCDKRESLKRFLPPFLRFLVRPPSFEKIWIYTKVSGMSFAEYVEEFFEDPIQDLQNLLRMAEDSSGNILRITPKELHLLCTEGIPFFGKINPTVEGSLAPPVSKKRGSYHSTHEKAESAIPTGQLAPCR